MFNISDKSFLFFMFFLGFSFLSLPSFADLIIEPEPYFVSYARKLPSNFISVRSLIFIVGGYGLLGLGIASLLKKIKWRWFIALAICLEIVALAGAIVDYVTQKGGNTGQYEYTPADCIDDSWE